MKQAELAKEKAVAKVAETQAQVQAAGLQAQAKMDAAERATEEAKTAEATRDAAVEAADEATRKTSPVSVFISRKTQRLYIRQGYQPVFETPVTIRDADKPIGSYVFTALSYLDNAEVRWSVVSMYKKRRQAAPPPAQEKRGKADARNTEAAPADVAGAKAALDRIAIPRDAIERISEVVLPGSSLIVSDEGASIETGKDTDFVVLMSGEPQGGIKARRREPRYRNDDSSARRSAEEVSGCFGDCQFLVTAASMRAATRLHFPRMFRRDSEKSGAHEADNAQFARGHRGHAGDHDAERALYRLAREGRSRTLSLGSPST